MLSIEMTPVVSSRIAAIGYSETQQTLAVRFIPTRKSPAGKIYHYSNVTPEIWTAFRNAESPGAYFAKQILNNPQYPYLCVDGGEDVIPSPVTACEMSPLPEDAAGLKIRALELAQQTKGLVIHTAQEFSEAGQKLKQLVVEKKQAQQRIQQLKTPAYQAYKATLQLEKDVLTPYNEAEQWIKEGIAAYLNREEQERSLREAALTLEARKLAQEEDRRCSALAAELDAQLLESQGDTDRAAELRLNPPVLSSTYVPPVVLQREAPKVEGVHSRKNWTFRIISESDLPREFLMPNEAAIRQVVRALKDKTHIPGVQVYCEETVMVRA